MTRRSVIALALGLSFAAALAACQKDRPNGSDNSSTGAANQGGSACSTPTLGCPCDSPGIQVSCGQVERRSGDYVSCSSGMETCGADGKWGACVGDGVSTTSVYAPLSGLGITALAGSSQTCVNNPCDPSCMNYTDSAGGLDAGLDSGLVTADAGMSITGTLVSAANSTCTGLQPMANQTMVVTSLSPIATTPATSNFTTSIIPAGCYTGSVTPLWGVDRFDVGVISTSGAYSHVVPVPAVVTVTGYAGSFSKSATVTVTVNITDTTTGPAPAGYTASSFTATVNSAEAAPKVLYPYTGTVFPLGLTAPLFMWQRATTNVAKAVKVSLTYTGFSWSAIIPEGLQRFQIPQSAWTAFGQTATGNTGTITLQRVDSTNKLQAAVSVSVKFAPANLRGRIYYTQYANSGNTGDIKSVLPYGSVAPVTLYSPAVSGGNCGVCHSMSADGSKFIASSQNAASTNGQSNYAISNVKADGTFQALNVGPAGGGDSRGLAFAALTKTGSYALLGNNWWGNVNGGANATTPGTAGPKFKIFQLPTTVGGAYPDVSDTGFGSTGNVWGLASAQMYTPVFSPDNTRLLFVDADTAGGAASRQGVSYWTFSEASKKFSGRTLAVKTTSAGPAAIKNTYVRWPNFEIDSRSVIFQTAATTDDDGFDWYAGMLPSGCCGRQKNHGQFWSMDLGPAGGPANAPVALGNLNLGLGAASPLGTDDTNRNYQPTMLPVSAGGYRWAVFTSIRAYGNFLNTATGALTADTNKLWVAAIDDATSGTVDRSHPPWLLPNQDLNAGTLNERGYWALDACKAPDIAASTCSGNDECCGFNPANVAASTALCKVDSPLASPPTFHCKSTSSAVCKTLGSSCSQNSDCCGFPPSPVCVSGTCQNLPPVIQYLAPSTFSRDYTATCAKGKSVKWRFFDWETLFPASAGSSIVFKAATAKTQATLGAATQVALGSQSSTNASWIGADVSSALTTGSQTSKAWLRVFITFNPTTDKSGTPTLTAWRQNYDCVDSE